MELVSDESLAMHTVKQLRIHCAMALLYVSGTGSVIRPQNQEEW